MVQFQNPFFKSRSKAVELDYVTGVEALQRGDFNAASVSFKAAAEKGHVSALFNLSLIWGGGLVTPYDFDLAADCWYKAAEAGHPKAKELVWQLEAADRGGFGAENLAKFAAEEETGDELIPSLMICAARFYDVICRKYGAVVDVIAYELDAAAMSEHGYVHSFLERTGIGIEFYRGGLNRLKSGSAADQITDGLNKFSVAMRASGASEQTTIMARCSIVGYIIQKSPYGENSKPLLGRDAFFNGTSPRRASAKFVVGEVSWPNPPETDEEILQLIMDIAGELPKHLPTEQDVYWFVVEEYDRLLEHGAICADVLSQCPLMQIEHQGRRSEDSYVGKPNPGVEYIENVASPVLIEQYGYEVGTRIRASIYAGFRHIGAYDVARLRVKYANHYHANCTKSGNATGAWMWSKVVRSVGENV